MSPTEDFVVACLGRESCSLNTLVGMAIAHGQPSDRTTILKALTDLQRHDLVEVVEGSPVMYRIGRALRVDVDATKELQS